MLGPQKSHALLAYQCDISYSYLVGYFPLAQGRSDSIWEKNHFGVKIRMGILKVWRNYFLTD